MQTQEEVHIEMSELVSQFKNVKADALLQVQLFATTLSMEDPTLVTTADSGQECANHTWLDISIPPSMLEAHSMEAPKLKTTKLRELPTSTTPQIEETQELATLVDLLDQSRTSVSLLFSELTI